MIKYLWRLLVVGFPESPKCKHTWETTNIMSISQANQEIGKIYTLKCSKCGEYKSNTIYY